MKKFIALIASVIAMSAQAAAVQDCRHDVAPVEIGRYAADQKNGAIISEEVIPVGSIITMSYKVGDDMTGWVTCRSTKVRKHATVKGGDVYDIGCGNLVRKVEKAQVRKDESVVAEKSSQAPVATGCVDDCGNVTYIRTVTNIVREVTVCEDRNGRQFKPDASGKCEFHTITASLPLKVESPSTAPCSQNCQERETAKVESWHGKDEAFLKFCAIRTDKKDLLGVFNHNGYVQVVKMTEANVTQSGEADFKNNPKAYRFTSQSISRFNGDCKTTTNAIVSTGWQAVVKELDLEKSCSPTKRMWRGAGDRVTVRS